MLMLREAERDRAADIAAGAGDEGGAGRHARPFRLRA
jgi:hypothetical protein